MFDHVWYPLHSLISSFMATKMSADSVSVFAEGTFQDQVCMFNAVHITCAESEWSRFGSWSVI